MVIKAKNRGVKINNIRSIQYKSLFLALFFILFLSAGSRASDITNENQNIPQGGNESFPPQAQESQEQSGQREMKAPPKEAIDACVGKKPGDICQLRGPHGNNETMPLKSQAGQSQSGEKENQVSSQQGPDGPQGNGSGVCEYTPDNKYFACRPNDMRPPDKGTNHYSEQPAANK